MAKQMTDDELNLRRKARRRLIGAIALTLAAVVILPMILDSEQKPSGQDIELRIPAPDKAGAFAPKTPAAAVVAASPAAAPAAGASSPLPEAAKLDAANQPVTTDNQPVTPSTPQNVAPAKAQPTPSKTPETKADDKPASTDGFVVQVGAYSNADTAKQELKKLKKWGFKAYTEKAGTTVRVRVGPYAEREKAEKILHQLEKHGLHPKVMSVR